jgi:hypothetical protein
MNLLKTLVTNLIFILISLFPLSLYSQAKQISKNSQAPSFYKIDGKDYFCTEKYHKIAEDGNKLKYCQQKLNYCSKINIKNDNIIGLCEASKKNLEQRLHILDETLLEKDRIASIYILDNEKLKEENNKLRSLSESKWYKSPILWFGFGIAAVVAFKQIEKL